MDGDYGRLFYLVLLLMAVGGWVVVEYRQRLGQALRVGLAWGLIFLGVVAGYGMWGDIRHRITPSQSLTGQNEITLPRAADGHFYAELVIDGTEVFFLVDTGATNLVLSQADAGRIGIDTSGLIYLGSAATANGIVRTARVTLDSLALGPFEDRDFPAYVNDGQMDSSLLGMDYLRRFRIEIDGDRMVLRR
ncbi:retropepsin-like aspartic protease family protein [Xinfangfangia pollutisoli]|uniref:retropepsin-like aspartic protease family protein n=1 Tax=Xinfangfangia pollutisoli TaxID=2865960 RepID=UPI001CD69F55|nr:TIGR02281 family clan AA aspartic protease [Xinfangfangia pollutisoli]